MLVILSHMRPMIYLLRSVRTARYYDNRYKRYCQNLETVTTKRALPN